jgi:hypothetical protein
MKKNSLGFDMSRLFRGLLVLTWCLLAVLPATAQTNSAGIPELPADSSTWGEREIFFAGMLAGFVVGGWGFVLRFVRQAARQNPEI